MKQETKKISRYAIAQIAIIVGQMSYAQPVTLKGNEMRLVDKKVFEVWLESLKKILDKEV